MNPGSLLLLLVLLLGASHFSSAAIIGTNSASAPLSQNRINLLPKKERGPWVDYLARSEKQCRADRTFFWKELQRGKTNSIITPPAGRGTRGISLDNNADWYRNDEAVRIADIIISFQTPAGGWSKNLDMTAHRR